MTPDLSYDVEGAGPYTVSARITDQTDDDLDHLQ